MRVHIIFIILISVPPLALAKEGFGPGEQDYGFVEVRPGAHVFYWFYHTTANVTDPAERPLIVWLDGGPGSSATGTANFGYVGPLDERLRPRENTWVKDYNILFVDCPLGAGFSYVEDLRLLNKNNKDTADDLVKLMKGFFDDVPKFKNSPLYIYGISYGGKIAADFGLALHKEVASGQIECNFKAISMGNAWISSMDFVSCYAQQVYQFSLIDERGLKEANEQVEHTLKIFDEGDYFLARVEWDRTLSLLNRLSGGLNMYDLTTKMPKLSEEEHFEAVVASTVEQPLQNSKRAARIDDLMNGPVRQALNITQEAVWGGQMIDLILNFYAEFITPVTSSIEKLLNDTDIEVHVLHGNLDLVANTAGARKWIGKLSWRNSQLFANATRETVWVNDTMEGYKQQGGGLSFYWLNGAGHFSFLDNIPGTKEFLRSVTGV